MTLSVNNNIVICLALDNKVSYQIVITILSNTKLKFDIMMYFSKHNMNDNNKLQNQYKLEGNCDFSSNNNVWTRFYEFFVGHF